MQRSIPLWAWGVLGFLALQAVHAWLPGSVSAEVYARVRELRAERDPRRMNVRELRQLPGVGNKLALVLARARDGHALARPLAWEDVPGIGEVRAREIRAWCRARDIEPDPLRAGRGAARGPSYPVGVEGLPLLLRPAFLVLLAACRDTQRSDGAAPASPPALQAAEREQLELEEAQPAQAIGARTLALQGGALHALEAGPARASLPEQDPLPEQGTLVLLLHGARFSARTWEELGTLALLARAGHHALAIDWPGYGATPDWGAEVDANALLTGVCDELGAERIVLVAPSLGGRFAFDFLRHSASRVAGLIAIAPAGADGFAPGSWTTPTLLVWGENDEVIPVAQGRALAERLSGARLEILPGASHPCYLDQTERFHALLLEFLGSEAGENAARAR